MVRCLNYLERPTAGQVQIDGQDLGQLSPQQLAQARQQIGMIFQHFNLLKLRTVAQNIAFPLEIARVPGAEIKQRVDELLAMVGLTDKAQAYPHQLSGGQKQRVGIARALACRPRLLLSDEATSALDPETTQSILALLKQINRNLGVTIILITHELAVIHQVCDRVGVLDEGRLVEMGSVTDVFSQPHASATRRLITTSGLVAGVARNKSVWPGRHWPSGRWYKVSALLADKALQKLILTATGQTLYMVGLSLAIALAVGVPLGVLLVVTAPGHILPRQQLNAILSSIVNTDARYRL